MGEARLLRVLSGPHQGAEMSLRPGRYTIGTDDDCDIVLSDSRLAPHHAFLILSDEGVSIEPGDGTVTVDGTNVDGRAAVADFKPVTMGATALALGPANATWPEIALPRSEPAPRPGNGDDAAPAAEPGPPAVATGSVTEPAPAASPAPPAAAASPASLPATAAAGDRDRGRRWWTRVAAAAWVLALIVAAGAVGLRAWDATHEDPATPVADAPTAQERAQAIVDRLGLGSALQVSPPAAGGRVVVQGYVEAEDQRRALVSALQPLLGFVEVRVWSTALLAQSLAQALAGMRLDLAVADVKDGKVVLTGVLTGSISEDELKDRLQRDVPGIASIDLQVVSLAEATRWLGEQITGIGVPSQTLSIARDGKRLVVDGRLAASQQGAWRDLAKAFGQRYGTQLSLQDDVTFAAAPVEEAAPIPSFDFNVRAINLGPPAYITLDGDAKYLVGSRLQNGMILEQIMATGLVLRDGETRHLVEIAEDSGRVTSVRQLETD